MNDTGLYGPSLKFMGTLYIDQSRVIVSSDTVSNNAVVGIIPIQDPQWPLVVEFTFMVTGTNYKADSSPITFFIEIDGVTTVLASGDVGFADSGSLTNQVFVTSKRWVTFPQAREVTALYYTITDSPTFSYGNITAYADLYRAPTHRLPSSRTIVL